MAPNIPNYSKVRYPNVYPGIDLIYYGNQSQLEYDFVVSPSADPDKILLDFEGADKAILDASGDLVMHMAEGDLRWHKAIDAYDNASVVGTTTSTDFPTKNAFQNKLKSPDADGNAS